MILIIHTLEELEDVSLDVSNITFTQRYDQMKMPLVATPHFL
jgi:hypothetical protein